MEAKSPVLGLLHTQRSHVLVVLSNARPSYEHDFRSWLRGVLSRRVSRIAGVLRSRYFEKDPIDITGGEFPAPPFIYLGLHDLSVDGAESAERIIDQILALHGEQPAAQLPAVWLYYPASERVGRAPDIEAAMVTVAYANAVDGAEWEFREWYATRHIRHAMNVPALVNGQCFQRTLFQKPGASEAAFSTIAIYEQEGTAQSMLESFALLPESILNFPSIDPGKARFAEGSYRPIEVPAEKD